VHVRTYLSVLSKAFLRVIETEAPFGTGLVYGLNGHLKISGIVVLGALRIQHARQVRLTRPVLVLALGLAAACAHAEEAAVHRHHVTALGGTLSPMRM
jgi:hypothetical protein